MVVVTSSLYHCATSTCFFQAEDGIRDLTVTGVQTCALPICPALRPVELEHQLGIARAQLVDAVLVTVESEQTPVGRKAEGRSEERRVGKEGRSRWSPDHLKKKKQRHENAGEVCDTQTLIFTH